MVAWVLTVRVSSMCELAQSVLAQVDAVPSEQMQAIDEVVVSPVTLAPSLDAAVAIPVLSEAVDPL
jgi:hypothetical protein